MAVAVAMGYGLWAMVPSQFNSRVTLKVSCLKKFRVLGSTSFTGNVIFRFSHSSILLVSPNRNFHFDQKTEQPSHLTVFGSGPLRALCIYFSSQILHQKTSSPLSFIKYLVERLFCF